jgi:general secretion pathway protein K
MTRTRGAALLLVLWLIVLLSALVGAFALTAKTEALQGRVLYHGIVAEQAARAGLDYAITRIEQADPRQQWLPDGRDYRWQFAGAAVTVKIVDESGKVDLNQADATLLGALFEAAGTPPDQAAQVAGAILDWRDPDPLTQPSGGAEDPDYDAAGRVHGAKDALFESVAEVEQVLGMAPDLYARVAPYLTVYSGRMQPDPTFAPGMVLQAMGLDAEPLLAQRASWDPASGTPPPAGQAYVGSNSGTYSIESRARLRNGREAVLRAVIRAGGNGVPGSAYTPLRWEEGASPR